MVGRRSLRDLVPPYGRIGDIICEMDYEDTDEITTFPALGLGR